MNNKIDNMNKATDWRKDESVFQYVKRLKRLRQNKIKKSLKKDTEK